MSTVEKTISVASVYKKPSLTTDPAESFLYVRQGSMKNKVSVYDKGTKKVLDWEEDEIPLKDSTYISMSKDAEHNQITLTLNHKKSKKAVLAVKKANWRDEVKINHKMTIKTNLPTLLLSTEKVSFYLSDGIVSYGLVRRDGVAVTVLMEILSFIQRIDAEVFCETSVPKYTALRVTFKKTVRGFYYVPDNLESRYFIHTQYLVGSYRFRSVTMGGRPASDLPE